jgi:hypothetical protein
MKRKPTPNQQFTFNPRPPGLGLPSTSWWLGKTREEFQQALAREAQRMQHAGTGVIVRRNDE